MIAIGGGTREAALIVALALLLPGITAASPVAAQDESSEPGFSAAVLIDPETRQVIYAHNPDERRAVASLTKMMTALLVAESGNLDRTVTVSERAAAVGQTTMNLTAGEQIRLRHLLAGIMLPSANDGATACAEAVSGSVEAFVERMNERAAELGMTGTSFANPHGLHDEDHYSTARDMALLGIQVMGRAELRPIVREKEIIVPWPDRPYDRKLMNRNRLVAEWQHCDGIKTGYTRQAGNCIAASAYVDGWRLICVLLDAEDTRAEARALLESGFNSFYKVALISQGFTKANVVVNGGVADTVDAYAADDVIAVMPRNERPEEPILLDYTCEAPVSKGDVVGRLGVTMPDGSMQSVDLLAAESVPQSTWARLLEQHWSFAIMALLVTLAVGVLVHGTVAEVVGSRGTG